MSRPGIHPMIVSGRGGEWPSSGFRRVVRNSALLNAVIVATSFPVLVLAGGQAAVGPALAVMAGITVMIWAATFTLFSCVSIGWLLWTTFSAGSRRKPAVSLRRAGVTDHWLDGPG